MPSPLDVQHAADWVNGFAEVKQTVVRRIGGDSSRTESVENVSVSDDQSDIAKVALNTSGLIDGDNGKFITERLLLDVPATQATLPTDTWVIDGKVYNQISSKEGADGGTKTIVVSRREPLVARHPRVNRR